MGVDIGTYHARIGSFAASYTRKNTTKGLKVEMVGWKTWFWGLLQIVMLVIGGVEVNPGPPAEQEKTNQILIHMRNQEKDSKVLNLLQTHNQEMAKMKKGTNVLSLKFEKLTEVIDKVISDYKENQTVNETMGGEARDGE
jgi:hypothetical protein